MILLQNANQIFFVCSPILKLGKYFSMTAVNKYKYKMKKFHLKLIDTTHILHQSRWLHLQTIDAYRYLFLMILLTLLKLLYLRSCYITVSIRYPLLCFYSIYTGDYTGDTEREINLCQDAVNIIPTQNVFQRPMFVSLPSRNTKECQRQRKTEMWGAAHLISTITAATATFLLFFFSIY